MTPNRLNRYISQMEAFRRKHEAGTVAKLGDSQRHSEFRTLAMHPACGASQPTSALAQHGFAGKPDEQYAWASDNLLQYGGSPQEDHG
jgi:hypothetical protein